MLKFDIRKQPNIPHLTDVLVDKLVEEANEVKEALYDSNISGPAYIQELLDVQQTLFAIFGNYKNHDTFGIIEHAMEEHNKKLATSHKEKYSLGDIQYIGYVDLNKPGDDPIEKLENKCENYSKQLKELINKNYDVKNTNRVQEAKIEELRGIISNLKENISGKNRKIESLKYIAQDLENTNRMLQEQLKETQDKLRRVQDNCKAKIQEDGERILNLSSKLAECDEDALREKDEEINKLRNELNMRDGAYYIMQSDCSKYTKDLKEKIRLKDLTIEKYKEAIDIKDKEIETSKAHLQRWIDLYNSLKSDNNEMLKSIMGYKETIDKQAAELKNRQNTISSLENTQVTLLEKKYNLSMEANRQLREEIQTLRIENGEYRDTIQRIENYLQELKTQQMD